MARKSIAKARRTTEATKSKKKTTKKQVVKARASSEDNRIKRKNKRMSNETLALKVDQIHEMVAAVLSTLATSAISSARVQHGTPIVQKNADIDESILFHSA